jgi:hypothetical protein
VIRKVMRHVAPQRDSLRGTFTLPSKYVGELVEIRTFVQPDAGLTIHGIKLERIK